MLPIDFKTKSQIKKIHKKSHQHWWGHHQPQSRSCIRLHHINPACKAMRSASFMAHPSRHPQPCSGTPCCWMLEFCWHCCCWVAVFYPVDTAIHYRAHGSVTTSHLLSAPYVKPVGRAESLIFLGSAPTFYYYYCYHQPFPVHENTWKMEREWWHGPKRRFQVVGCHFFGGFAFVF